MQRETIHHIDGAFTITIFIVIVSFGPIPVPLFRRQFGQIKHFVSPLVGWGIQTVGKPLVLQRFPWAIRF